MTDYEIDNVTQRKQKHGHSLDFNDSEFDTDVSYQSEPSIIGCCNEEQNALSDRINKLTTELQIANNEIENLNIENVNMKKEIETYKNKIKLLKSVGATEPCTSNNFTPLKFYSPQYRRRIKCTALKIGLPRLSSRELTTSVINYQTPKTSRLPTTGLLRNYDLYTKSPQKCNSVDMAIIMDSTQNPITQKNTASYPDRCLAQENTNPANN